VDKVWLPARFFGSRKRDYLGSRPGTVTETEAGSPIRCAYHCAYFYLNRPEMR